MVVVNFFFLYFSAQKCTKASSFSLNSQGKERSKLYMSAYSLAVIGHSFGLKSFDRGVRGFPTGRLREPRTAQVVRRMK